MTALTAAAKKIRAKRASRPIHPTCMRVVDPTTGEELGAFVPLHDIGRRLVKDRGYRAGREYRLEIKESHNAAFNRLAHVIGHLLVDNVEAFRELDAHAVLKQVQLESGICCEMVEMDASPVVKALLDAAETVLGAGARKVLAAVLPQIRAIPVKVPQSPAFDSEEDDFAAFFKGITGWIGNHYAHVMLDDVRADYWRMVNGRQQGEGGMITTRRFALRSRRDFSVTDRLERRTHSCRAIPSLFERRPRLANKGLGERILIVAQTKKHSPQMILLRNQDVDIAPSAAHQMKAASKLIKFRISIKKVPQYLLTLCERKCQIA